MDSRSKAPPLRPWFSHCKPLSEPMVHSAIGALIHRSRKGRPYDQHGECFFNPIIRRDIQQHGPGRIRSCDPRQRHGVETRRMDLCGEGAAGCGNRAEICRWIVSQHRLPAQQEHHSHGTGCVVRAQEWRVRHRQAARSSRPGHSVPAVRHPDRPPGGRGSVPAWHGPALRRPSPAGPRP